MTTTRIASLAAVALASAALASAQNSGPVEQLLQRITSQERQLVTSMKSWTPNLEVYIQELKTGDGGERRVVSDLYMLGKLQFGKGVDYATFVSRESPKKRDPFFLFRKGQTLTFLPEGFAQMTILDAYDFSSQVYSFEYVRREFLGEVRCLVFDVTPKDRNAGGKFVGRIWVEDRGYAIVRFNGTYTQSKTELVYFHFDSWRVETAPGVWVPALLYAEEDGDKTRLGFKAQGRLWGYESRRTAKIEELASILVESDQPLKDEAGGDTSPLENQRGWARQAEENYVQRLEKTGLLAPRGKVDEVLNTVVNNLMATSNLNLDVQCRVLLTTPFETFSIGQTIAISRGLLDVLPDEASLAVVLSEELAHIALGHRTDTMYAFGDRTMFDDKDIPARLHLSRPDKEMEEAARKALDILARSPYKDKLGTAGLFLKALASRAPELPNLIHPNLGTQLAFTTGLVRLAELAAKGPELQENRIEQVAALPLGSRVKLDPWTSQISLVKTKALALLSAREKMPFEITPFLVPLTRVVAAKDPESAPAQTGQIR